MEMRRAHPGWGPRTIGYYLEREGVVPVPCRSSIYRCLVRHHLIDPQQRGKRRSDYKRWERARSMELWQMDVMGGVYLVDGSELKVVTGIDDHSRFCISAKVVRSLELAEVLDVRLVPDYSDRMTSCDRRLGIGPEVFETTRTLDTMRSGSG